MEHLLSPELKTALRPVSRMGALIWLLCGLLLSGCSMGQMVARSSLSIMDSGVAAMNQESDWELAKAAIPANLKLAEGLIGELPREPNLRLQAAQGFYGYAFGFVEDDNPPRAAALYRRGMEHALVALDVAGLKGDVSKMPTEQMQQMIAAMGKEAVPALFWTASNWAKWIDLNRTDPARLAELGKVEALMQRVLALDENYYFGGPHLFFAIFYGNRPPMLGGNLMLAQQHFEKARASTQGRLLLADVLYAQYVARQQGDRKLFHDKLTAVIGTPTDDYSDMALANTIAQHKAKWLLTKEEEWF